MTVVESSKVNRDKVLVESLKLLGWSDVQQGSLMDSPLTWTATSPTGQHHQDNSCLGFYPSVPKPDRNLADAEPLMKLCCMALEYGFDMIDGSWEAVDAGRDFTVVCDEAALAVCLCALLTSGRDLKEFLL